MLRSLWLRDDRQRMNNDSFEVFHNFTNQVVEVAPHVHDFYEVLLFLRGNVDYLVEGRSYKLRQGDIVITNSMEVHCPIINDSSSYDRFVVWVNPQLIAAITAQLSPDFPLNHCFEGSQSNHCNLLHPDSSSFAHLVQLLDRIIQAQAQGAKQQAPQPGDTLLQQLLLLEFLVLLNQAYVGLEHESKTDVVSDPTVNEIISHINQHLSDDLSIERLGSIFKLDRYYLMRRFQKVTGLRLHQFIIQKRLSYAKKLMMQGHKPSQAAFEAGFNDYSNFSRTFRVNYEQSPAQFYRNQSLSFGSAKQQI